MHKNSVWTWFLVEAFWTNEQANSPQLFKVSSIISHHVNSMKALLKVTVALCNFNFYLF